MYKPELTKVSQLTKLYQSTDRFNLFQSLIIPEHLPNIVAKWIYTTFG
jgi:hypothetical protein